LGAQASASVAATLMAWLQQYQQQDLPTLTSIALTGEHALQDDNAEIPPLQMQLHHLTDLPVWLFDPFIHAPKVCQVQSASFQHHRRGAYIRALGLALRNRHTWRG